MSRPAYLIAFGPNEIEIISMIFKSFDEGLAWVRENSELEWHIMDTQDFIKVAKHNGYINEKPSPFCDKVFVRYYFGCGGVDSFQLREVEYNTPLCGFNLD
jgi:hypothetical protein